MYCGDSLDLVSLWGRRSIDLVVADAPYGVEFKSGFADHDPIVNDDNRGAVPGMLARVMRPLKEGAHAYVFGFQAHELPGLFASAVDLIWDKGVTGMGDLSAQWSKSHEPITFGVYYSDAHNRSAGRGGLSARMRKGSVLRVPRLNARQARRHPTEKPVLLLRQLVESSSVVDDVVMDPFAGVGSTAVAAVLLGRRAVSIEIEEAYCRVAAGRQREASDVYARSLAL